MHANLGRVNHNRSRLNASIASRLAEMHVSFDPDQLSSNKLLYYLMFVIV